MNIAEVLTESAVAALEQAQDLARSLGHGYVGTEHVVCALAETPSRGASALHAQGVSSDALRGTLRAVFDENEWTRYVPDADALASIGVDLDAVTSAAEAEFGSGVIDGRRGNPGLTARLVSLCEQAASEARSQSRRAEPDDLWAALLRDEVSVAVTVLERSGVDLGPVLAAAARP